MRIREIKRGRERQRATQTDREKDGELFRERERELLRARERERKAGGEREASSSNSSNMTDSTPPPSPSLTSLIARPHASQRKNMKIKRVQIKKLGTGRDTAPLDMKCEVSDWRIQRERSCVGSLICVPGHYIAAEGWRGRGWIGSFSHWSGTNRLCEIQKIKEKLNVEN